MWLSESENDKHRLNGKSCTVGRVLSKPVCGFSRVHRLECRSQLQRAQHQPILGLDGGLELGVQVDGNDLLLASDRKGPKVRSRRA